MPVHAELSLNTKKELGNGLTVLLHFAYSIVTGKSSSADEGVLVLRGDLDESIKEEFVLMGSTNICFI